MKNNHIKIKGFLLALIFLMINLHAQSYEGYIAKFPLGDNPLWIWVDLITRTSDTVVSGTYFYKLHGGKIKLSGTRSGKVLTLFEKNNKQKTTGIFSCIDLGDSMNGTWRKITGGDSLMVRVYNTNPLYRKCSKIPKSLWAGGSITFARKGLINVLYVTEHMGAYPSEEWNNVVIDLSSYKTISLPEEIDTAKREELDRMICEEFQKQLTVHRKHYPDSMWLQSLIPYDERGVEFFDTSRVIDYFFTVNDSLCDLAKGLSNYSLETDNKLYIWAVKGLFNFPHVIQALDFSCIIEIPFPKLNQYLKPTSILRNLAKTQ